MAENQPRRHLASADGPHAETVDASGPMAHDPLAAMRDRWVMCAVLTIALAVAGFGLSRTHQTQFTAETRLAVGSNSLQAYQVAGFAVASEALAANYARFVSGSPATTKALEDSLQGRAREVTSIDASPIPDSNVVRIEARAINPEVAGAAADAVAKNLVHQVNAGSKMSPHQLLAKQETLTVAVLDQQAEVKQLTIAKNAAAQAGQPIDKLQAELARAHARLVALQLQKSVTGVQYQQILTGATTQNNLREIQPAALTGDDKRRTQELYTVSGLLGGLLLGLVVSNFLERRRRPRRQGRLSSSARYARRRKHPSS
jgi:capsular polysaccharide biosynthesis protein